MYGTVRKMQVKAENVDAVRKVMAAQMRATSLPGYISPTSCRRTTARTWLFVMFEDKASYMARTRTIRHRTSVHGVRALMEADPEWHDGMVDRGLEG